MSPVEDTIKTMALSRRATSRASTAERRYPTHGSDTRRATSGCSPRMRIDAHQHFWHYDPVEYALDRRLDAGAAARFPARGRAGARCRGAASIAASPCRRGRRSRKRAGCSSSPTRTRSLPAWSAGSICSRRRSTRQLETCRAASEAGRRPPHRAGGAGRVSVVRRVPPRRRAARALRPDLRHPDLRSAAAGSRRPSSARFPSQRFVLDHLGKPDIKGGGYQALATALRGSWPHSRTSGASCPAWSPKRTGDRGRRSSCGRTSRRRSTASARSG